MSDTPQQPLLSPDDFAAKIRAKYPGAYDNTNNTDLTTRVIAKYPQYKAMVDMNANAPSSVDPFSKQPTSNGSQSQPAQPTSFWDKTKQSIVGPGTAYDALSKITLPKNTEDARTQAWAAISSPTVSAEPFFGGQPQSVMGGIGKAIAEVGSGLTSIPNAATMIATGGLGELGAAGGAIEKLIAGGFSIEQIKGAYDQFKQINPSNTSGEVAYHATAGILSGLLARQGAMHALGGEPLVAPKPAEAISIPDTQAKTPEQVFNESSLAPPAIDQEVKAPISQAATSTPHVEESQPVSETPVNAPASPSPEPQETPTTPQPQAELPAQSQPQPATPSVQRPVESTLVPPVPRDLTQLHPNLASSFDAMSKLQLTLDRSTSESLTANTLDKMAAVKQGIDPLIRETLNQSPETLAGLRTELDYIVAAYQKTADAINDALRQREMAETRAQVIEAKKQGYSTSIQATDPETGEPTRIDKDAQVATLGRSLLAHSQGLTPNVTLDDFVPHLGKEGMTADEWKTTSEWGLNQLKSDYSDISKSIETMRDTGSGDWESIHSRIQDLDRDAQYLGRFPKMATEAGGNLKAAPIQDAQGNIRPPAPLEKWMTLNRANALLKTTNLRSIPKPEVFEKRAAQLENLAQQHRALSDAISQKIGLPAMDPSERGGVGEAPALAKSDTMGSAKALQIAKSKGLDTWSTSDDRPAGNAGWLSADGKTWINRSSTAITHSDLAEALLPHLASDDHDLAELALLQHGWVRKVTPNEYEAHILDDKQTDVMEMDMFRNRTHGQIMTIDTKGGDGRIHDLTLSPGWDESFSNLKEAIDAEKRRENFPAQTGVAPGYETMGGMAAGMAVGHAVGGPAGAAIGAVVGGISPSVLRSAAVVSNMKKMWPAINKLGISASDWFQTSKKNSTEDPSIDQAGQDRLKHQWIYRNSPGESLATRMSLLTSKIAIALNPYARINDQAGPIERWAMANDTKLKAFRDAQGKFSVLESPYVAVMLAADNIRGKINNFRSAFYGAIERDVNATSDKAVTTHYLNLRGDIRTYDNLDEQSQDLQKQMGSLQQQLAAPNLGAVEEARLQNQLKEAQLAHKDLIDRVTNGNVVSGGFTRGQVEQRLQQFQQDLGPERFARVQGYANRLYDANRKVLDYAYNDGKGTISKEDYDTYTARGNEYIPMKRILTDQAENLKNSFGTGPQSLYLNHSNVIHQMEGSERDNIDPFQASTNQMALVVNERVRNDAALKMLYSAAGDPLGIGSFFKRVSSAHTPDADHQVIGAYINGKVQKYEVPKELAAVLEHASPRGTNLISNAWVRASTGLAKFGMTTGNLYFTARQSVTMAEKLAIGRTGVNMKNPMSDSVALGKTFASSIKSAFVHDAAWHEANEMGVFMGNVQNQFTPELQMSPKELAGNLAKTVGAYGVVHPITTMAGLNNFVTDSAKLTAFTRYRQMGHSPVEAQYLTKVYGPLPDYSGMGAMNPGLLGAAKAATLFLSADVIHLAQVAQMATDKEVQPKLALLYAASMAATYGMVAHNSQQKNPDGSLMINEVPDYIRNKNMVYLTGNRTKTGTPAMIQSPKSDIHRTLFNSSEDAMYKAFGQSDKSGKQIVADQISNLIPGNPTFDANQVHGVGSALKEGVYKTATGAYSQILPAVRTPFEMLLNRQVNFGDVKPINTEKNISPSMQGFGSSSISPTAMAIGSRLNGIGLPPPMLEHLARENFGPLATGGEALLNPLFQGGTLPNGMKIPASQGVPKAQTSNGAEQQAMFKFRNDAAVIAQPYTDYQALKQKDPNAAEQWAQQHRDQVQRGAIASKGIEGVQRANAAIQKVQALTTLDPNAKAQMIDNIKNARKSIMDNISSLMTPQTQKTQSGYGTGNATSQGLAK